MITIISEFSPAETFFGLDLGSNQHKIFYNIQYQSSTMLCAKRQCFLFMDRLKLPFFMVEKWRTDESVEELKFMCNSVI